MFPFCSTYPAPMARDFITLSEMSQAVLGITCDLCQRREQFDVDTSHRSQNAAVVADHCDNSIGDWQGDTDPCWAARVIQSEKGRPAAVDEWTPKSFARTFGQTIVSLTDAGQSMHHYCNPTFCEEVITDGKIVAYRDTSAGKPDLSSVCYAVQGNPEIRKCLYNSGEKILETHHNHEWNTLTVFCAA